MVVVAITTHDYTSGYGENAIRMQRGVGPIDRNSQIANRFACWCTGEEIDELVYGLVSTAGEPGRLSG